MPAGRPSDYTPELADELCAKLADGQSLRKVCESDEFPSKTTIFTWLRTIPEFLDHYVQAKEEAADSMADDINQIADNIGSFIFDEDGNLERDQDGNPITQIDMVAVNHAKLKIDARKWTASKLKPKKYGDKVDHTHGGGDKPIEQHWKIEVVNANLTDSK